MNDCSFAVSAVVSFETVTELSASLAAWTELAVIVVPGSASAMMFELRTMSTPSMLSLASLPGTLMFAGSASPSVDPVSTNEAALAVPVVFDATIKRY